MSHAEIPVHTAPCILYVEDNDAKRYALSKALRQAGYEITEAASGAAALEALAAKNPAVAVIDVRLPDTDGYELCRELKNRCEIPVFLVSTHVPNTLKLGKSGADAFLEGYSNIEEFVKSFQRLIPLHKPQLCQ